MKRIKGKHAEWNFVIKGKFLFDEALFERSRSEFGSSRVFGSFFDKKECNERE